MADATLKTGGLMEGKRGLIMGVANDHSIAWGIARTLHAHGAKLAFTYQGDALKKRVEPLAAQVGADMVLPCDVEKIETVDATFAELGKQWGGLDFFVHAIGYQHLYLTFQLLSKHDIIISDKMIAFDPG